MKTIKSVLVCSLFQEAPTILHHQQRQALSLLISTIRVIRLLFSPTRQICLERSLLRISQCVILRVLFALSGAADSIATCGFSAGGHLTASEGVHYNDIEEKNPLYSNVSARPDAMLLCYPVITSGPYTHEGSMQNLLGANPTADELKYMSLETQVTSQTPPSFLSSCFLTGSSWTFFGNSFLGTGNLRRTVYTRSIQIYY